MKYVFMKSLPMSPQDFTKLLGVKGMKGQPSLSVQKDENGDQVVILDFPGVKLTSGQLTKLRELALKLGWGDAA